MIPLVVVVMTGGGCRVVLVRMMVVVVDDDAAAAAVTMSVERASYCDCQWKYYSWTFHHHCPSLWL